MFIPKTIRKSKEGYPLTESHRGADWEKGVSLDLLVDGPNGYVLQVYTMINKAFLAYAFNYREGLIKIPVVEADLSIFGGRFESWTEFLLVVIEMFMELPAIEEGYRDQKSWRGIRRQVNHLGWAENSVSFMKRIWNVPFSVSTF